MLAFVAIALTGYVALRVAPELVGARRLLAGPVEKLTRGELASAQDNLTTARDHLDGVAANFLRLLPVTRQNVDALARVTDSLLEVVEAGFALDDFSSDLEDSTLLAAGNVDLEAVGKLERFLAVEARALTDLEQSLQEGLNGWLLPPLWAPFDATLQRVQPLAEGARNTVRGLELAEPMLGAEGKRTYLVVLMNNAELRATGGLPSGAGVIVADHGRIELGDFRPARDLRGGVPYRKVPSSPAFERRFGRYGADTTLWVNSTMSPDAAEVAEVVAGIGELRFGRSFDGVLFADPHGLASLVPRNAELRAPAVGATIRAEDLPTYVMSDAYDEFSDRPPERKETLIELGESAFEVAVDEGFSSLNDLVSAGRAVLGGHLKLVSFDESEARVLNDLGISGRLPSPDADGVLVTAQNIGADKLDYWARREVLHDCDVEESRATCTTRVKLRNIAPKGLTRYVANDPYGLLESYVEVYVPRRAEIVSARRDGEPASVTVEAHKGMASIGTIVRLPRGEQTVVSVRYSLPLEGSYSLVITPQPLSTPAEVAVKLSVPDGWIARGADTASSGEFTYSGELTSPLEVEAGLEARPGVEAAWRELVRFWNQPISLGG